MALFLVTYDLEYPENNHKTIEAVLTKWGARRVLDSTWMVRMDSSETMIFDAMWAAMNQVMDRIVVVKVYDGTWKAYGTIEDITDL